MQANQDIFCGTGETDAVLSEVPDSVSLIVERFLSFIFLEEEMGKEPLTSNDLSVPHRTNVTCSQSSVGV